MEDKKFLSIKQTAGLLDVKVDTLLKWIRAGKFPRPDSRINRKCQYWKAESVNLFLESHKPEGRE